MDYVVIYSGTAIVLSAITLLIFININKVPSVTSRLQVWLIVSTLLAAIFDVGSTLNLSNNMLLTMNTGYYLTHTSSPILYLLYVSAFITKTKDFRKLVAPWVYIPQIVNLLFVISNPITKFYFYYEGNGVYIRGPFQIISYITSAFYFIFILQATIRNRRKITKLVLITANSFSIAILLVIVVQFINPNMLVECYAASMCLLINMFTCQSQADSIEMDTGLLNRRSFLEQCLSILSDENNVTIVIMKIPEFTFINSKAVSSVSNQLLSRFSKYLSECVNFGEAYYLEDECFAVITPKNTSKAEAVYDKVQKRLEENWNIGNVDTYITAYGMKMTLPEDAVNIEGVISCINQFKLANINSSKLIAGNEILQDYKRRIKVEEALENNEFFVCYQPIYSCEQRKIISCEALVRLQDEELGCISPDEFIPIAEDNGRIIQIGLFVFEEVCKFITDKNVHKIGIEYVNVNLSVIQCMQSNLIEQITQIMHRYSISPSEICFELTETASAFTPYIMEKNIRELADMGFLFALDDYGTGFSNMNYLLNLPFSIIKLEKGMIWDSFKNAKTGIAIDSTIALARNLNIMIVAEGVETIDQANVLFEKGFDYLQGFYFSKPVVKDKFFEMIKIAKDPIVVN